MKKNIFISIIFLASSVIVSFAIFQPKHHGVDGVKSVSEIQLENERHVHDLQVVSEAWKNIRSGDFNLKRGRYIEAVQAYEKAYSLDRGSRAVSGMLLSEAYEKVGRYDDGIALANEMIKDGVLSQKGVKHANEIKSRLVAAKANASEVQQNNGGVPPRDTQ